MNKTPLTVMKDTAPFWAEHFGRWHGCSRCSIGLYAKHHVVARGRLPCDILFLGEAPGDVENDIGYPFLGKAGQIFDALIDYLELLYANKQDEPNGPAVLRWAVTNTVLCRPADSADHRFRAPSPEEKSNCRERLDEFIQTVAQPRGIVCLGKHASEAAPFLLRSGDRIPIPTVHIYHPSYIAHNGGLIDARGKEIFDREIGKLKAFIKQTVNL